MSTRKITNEQFSDLSTIDGSRIAKAIAETVEITNNVPLDSIAKPRSAQFVILGAYPPNNAAAATTSPPWIAYNRADSAGDPVFRAKGVVASETAGGVFPTTDGGLWTAATLFDRPVIIDTICVHIDSWDGWPIRLHGVGAGNNDIGLLQLLIDTDDVTSPEDRTKNAKEFHYRNFDPTVWEAKDLNNGVAPTVNMVPAVPTKLKDGSAAYPSHVVEYKDINLPIHQMARVRFRLAFARKGTNASAAGSKSWETPGAATMHPGQPTWVIVYKEQVRG